MGAVWFSEGEEIWITAVQEISGSDPYCSLQLLVYNEKY